MRNKNEVLAEIFSQVEAQKARQNITNQENAESVLAAHQEVEKYLQLVESLSPQARQQYEAVISPWLAEIAPDLIALSPHLPLCLSTGIEAHFPETALRTLELGTGKVQADEVWVHSVYLNPRSKSLEVRRQPATGIRGFAHALSLQQFFARDRGSYESLVEAQHLNPDVILQFAQQIENGEVYSTLQESIERLKPYLK